MTTIDLQRDCELWATFDSEDVDSQRGIVRDRSGKGRTLKASGGPTYGASSPVGEAVGFDGTDDELPISRSSEVRPSGDTEFSVTALVRWDGGSSSSNIDIFHFGGFEAILGKNGNNFPAFAWWDTSDASHAATDSDGFPQDTWVWLTGVKHSDGSSLVVNSATKSFNSTTGTIRTNGNGAYISGNGSGRQWSGDIAFGAVHNRELSQVEIQALHRMTDRMVSKL